MIDILDRQNTPPDGAQQGALPVFIQIAEDISRQIAAGHLIADTKLPPERQMAADYGVAVGTLRKALARLTALGLVMRKQGSGNYIARTQHAASLYSFFRLEKLTGGGMPSARLIDVMRLQKPNDLPSFGTTAFAHRFRRVRYLDEEPVALEEIWLDGACADKIEAKDVSQSLYYFYRTQLNLWVTKAEDWVSIAPPPPWYKGQIETQMGFIERFGWSREGNKIEYSRTWFAPLRARYVARLK